MRTAWRHPDVQALVIARVVALSGWLVYLWAMVTQQPIGIAIAALVVAGVVGVGAQFWVRGRMRRFRDAAAASRPELLTAHGLDVAPGLFYWGWLKAHRDLAAEPSVRADGSLVSSAQFVEAVFRIQNWSIVALAVVIVLSLGVLIGMGL